MPCEPREPYVQPAIVERVVIGPPLVGVGAGASLPPTQSAVFRHSTPDETRGEDS